MNFGGKPDTEMKKALEAELKLDGTDLRSHLWYHGQISRDKAEKILTSAGEFLVRDCISRPGDYVLTCCWDGKPLHFMINRVLLNSNSVYEKVLYQFEDEQFHSVPDLVRFYVGHKKAVTNASGAVLSTPLNRKIPLSLQNAFERISFSKTDPSNNLYMEGAFHGGPSDHPDGKVSAGIDNLSIPPISAKLLNRPLPQPPKSDLINNNRPKTSETSVSHNLSMGDLTADKISGSSRFSPALAGNLSKVGSSMTNLTALKQSQAELMRKSFAQSRNFVSSGDLVTRSSQMVNKSSLTETTRASSGDIRLKTGGSLERMSVCPSSQPKSKEPAKPQRAPSIRSKSDRPSVIIRNKLGKFEEIEMTKSTESNLDDYEFHEYCDIDYEEIDGEITPKAEVENKQSSKRPHSVEFILDRDSACVLDYSLGDKNDLRLRPSELAQVAAITDQSEPLITGVFTETIERGIQRSGFSSFLLTSDYTKPLDDSVWEKIDLLLKTNPENIAVAIFSGNLNFMRQFQPATSEENNDCYVMQQLGLFFVPQAETFRLDFLERCRTFEFFVISSILKCDAVKDQGARMALWIKVAERLKETMKDLCGFSCVMNALGSKPIEILGSGWSQLRSSHTTEAIMYETRLKPSWKALERNEMPSECQERICFPDLIPIAKLLAATSPADLWLFEWEDRLDDFGLDIFWSRLSQYRSLYNTGGLEKFSFVKNLMVNYGAVYDGMKEEERGLEDMFKTEFQLRYLWGSKGETVETQERFSKFSHLLNLLAEKRETLNQASHPE